MKRAGKTALIVLVLIIAAAQLIRPATENRVVDPSRSLWNDARVDQRVAGILRRACADCHSHETQWPWYAKVSPVSWMMARHVNKGRAKLNFSEWASASTDQIEEIYDSVRKNKMPLKSYLIVHPQARLSEADRKVLLAWADGRLTAPVSNSR